MRRVFLAIFLTACLPPEDQTPPADDAVDRGPTEVHVQGDPNGLWWDAATSTLLIADDDNNRILQWTDAEGIAAHTTLPPEPANGAGLGQVVQMSDGTLVVPRFGYGTTGEIVFVRPDGTTHTVPNLDPERRRIGMAVADDDALYSGWFVSQAGVRFGSVGALDLSGTETLLLEGLGKTAGVLWHEGWLYITDQDEDALLRFRPDAPETVESVAVVIAPDLLTAGPDGSLFTGGKNGEVRRIGTDGTVTTFAAGMREIRGVAYDAANERLFAVEHDAEENYHAIHIFPVDP